MDTPFRSLADSLGITQVSLEQVQASPEQPSQLGQARVPTSAFALTRLGPELIEELSQLGEELLEPRAELSRLSKNPGAGPSRLGGMPGRLLSQLSQREAGRKGGQAVALKRSAEERRRISQLGVAARRNLGKV